MFASSLAAGLEKALNLYLDADSEMAAGLDRIAGRRVLLELEGTGLQLMLLAETGGHLAVHSRLGDAPDATIRATPLALVQASLSGGSSVSGSAIAIEGDAEVAERLWSVLRSIELDWEEWLSQLTGDVLGHAIADRLRRLGAWEKRSRRHLADSLGEYVTEESRLSPGHAELDDFMDAVDRLREDVDRLEARLDRLARHDKDDQA